MELNINIAPNINCKENYIQGGVYLTGSKNEINVEIEGADSDGCYDLSGIKI